MANATMTNRKLLTAIVEGNVTPEIVEYAKAQITKLDEKNKKRRETGTANQRANEGIKEAIIASMEAGVTYTAAEIVTFGIDGITSTQKVSPLMSQLSEAGKVTISEVKIKGKGKVNGYTLVNPE
jgi:hypothetical protein